MVIYIIYVGGVSLFKSKGYAPVPTDRHSLVSRQVAFQSMQPQTRSIHILWVGSRIKQRHDLAQAPYMRLLNTLGLVVVVERRKPFMTNIPNYR